MIADIIMMITVVLAMIIYAIIIAIVWGVDLRLIYTLFSTDWHDGGPLYLLGTALVTLIGLFLTFYFVGALLGGIE